MTVHTTQRRRAGIALAVALTATLALSGCAAGQDAETSHEVSVVDGAQGDAGSMSVRDAGVIAPTAVTGYAAGSTAQLSLVLVNNSATNDLLTAVTSPAATSAVVSPAFSPVVATSAVTSSSTDAAVANTPVTVPANNLVRVGTTGGAGIALVGLKGAIISGQSIAVTFTFQTAGSVTIQLPVKLISDSTAGQTVDVEPSTAG